MTRSVLIIALLWGFAMETTAQKTVICQLAGDFNEGVAPFQLDNKWGFMDTRGNVLIEPRYKTDIWNTTPIFNHGMAAVRDPSTGNMFYILPSGEPAFDRQFPRAYEFSDGIAFVQPTNYSTTAQLINSKGENITGEFRVDDSLKPFACGRALSNRKYLDKSGKISIEGPFTAATSFSDGLAAVQEGYAKWGFIDTTGTVVIPYRYTREPKPFSDGRAFVQGSNGKWGIIDKEGNLITEPVYNVIYPFNSGVAVVSMVGERWTETWYIIDTEGKVVKTFAPVANTAETITLNGGFSEGVAIATKGYKKGLIDTKGNPVTAFVYRLMRPASGGMAYFEKMDDKTKKIVKGFLDTKGKEMIYLEDPMF